MIYAVFDTNVIISSLLSKHADSATVLVVEAIAKNQIVPLYNYEILAEYDAVLHRERFGFTNESIQCVLRTIESFGLDVENPTRTGIELADKDDVVLYEVAMEKRKDDAYLITGNIKHFPERSFIVTPAEMMEILIREKTQQPQVPRQEYRPRTVLYERGIL